MQFILVDVYSLSPSPLWGRVRVGGRSSHKDGTRAQTEPLRENPITENSKDGNGDGVNIGRRHDIQLLRLNSFRPLFSPLPSLFPVCWTPIAHQRSFWVFSFRPRANAQAEAEAIVENASTTIRIQ